MPIAKILLFLGFITLLPGYAYAYVGPGLGAGTIGVILGIIGSIFIALFAIIWYPLKRLFKKRRETKSQQNESES